MIAKRKQSYPWKKWADGETHLLRQGVDYVCTTRKMRMVIRSWAVRHGRSYEIERCSLGLVVKINHPRCGECGGRYVTAECEVCKLRRQMEANHGS